VYDPGMSLKHRLGEPYEYGGSGVDVKLYSERDPSDVWWSPRKPSGGGYNSYVIVHDPRGPFRSPKGDRVSLVSVNGHGEIRWDVQAYRARSFLERQAKGEELRGDDVEMSQGFHHFKLRMWDESVRAALPRRMTREEEHLAVQEAIARFPETFGLRAYPGETFRIGVRESYYSDHQRQVLLYTQRKMPDGQWRDFAKGSEEELRRELSGSGPGGYRPMGRARATSEEKEPLEELHTRIANTLGWKKSEVRSFSLAYLREMVRQKNPKLAGQISDVIQGGLHIYGAVRPGLKDDTDR
jgi:hypothetical protein